MTFICPFCGEPITIVCDRWIHDNGKWPTTRHQPTYESHTIDEEDWYYIHNESDAVLLPFEVDIINNFGDTE